jgi:hypothetical protein
MTRILFDVLFVLALVAPVLAVPLGAIAVLVATGTGRTLEIHRTTRVHA